MIASSSSSSTYSDGRQGIFMAKSKARRSGGLRPSSCPGFGR
jgi:hypothetical protein